MENYFTDAIHYQEALETGREATSGNELDTEPDPDAPRSITYEKDVWYVNDYGAEMGKAKKGMLPCSHNKFYSSDMNHLMNSMSNFSSA